MRSDPRARGARPEGSLTSAIERGVLTPLTGRVSPVPIGMSDPSPVVIYARFRIGGVDRPHPEQTLDATDHAANCAADDRADRSRRSAADIGAVGDAVGNALRLRRERRCERCGGCRGEQNRKFHATPSFLCVETVAA